MGFIDEISKALSPHAKSLQDSLNLHGALIHQRLQSIENALITPVIGDKWQRLTVNNALTEGQTIELGTVPLNEIWVLQTLVVDGIFAKAPAFVIEAANRLVASVIKEGVGSEKIGGDCVALPGEVVTLTARTAGTISACLHFVRKPLPAQKLPDQRGRSADITAPSNTHDPNRDILLQRLAASYAEIPGETRDTTGRPSLAK